MLTYLTESEQFELDGELAAEGALLACVWLRPNGDYAILTNTDHTIATHILAGAVLAAVGQEGGSCH